VDVYSYFNKLRALKESTTSERAAELGYEYRSRGVWLDPKNGKRYKAKGTQFVELKPQETGERGPGGAQPDEIAGSQLKDAEQAAAEPQQTFSNFTSQMARVVPGGPTEFNLQQGDVEASAKQLARGRWDVLDDKQKKKYRQQAEFEIKRAEEERKAAEEAQAAAEAEAEMMAQEQEPEGLDDLLGDIQGKKRPEEFPQLKDVAKERTPKPRPKPNKGGTMGRPTKKVESPTMTPISGNTKETKPRTEVSDDVKFINKPGFTDELPSSNEEYIQKIKDKDYGNGVEFVDLREVIDTDNIGFPSKYLDVLSRALVTKNVEDETDNWSHYGEGLAGGAGQIKSQMGELMFLVFSTISPEDRKKLSEVIRSKVKEAKTAGSVKKDLTITEDWIDASLNSANALGTYMSLEAPGAKIVGGAWDQPDELNSLGIGEGGEKKGFSTDVVIRDSNGKNHQISLKKDANVNFLNSGAGQYTKFYLAGALEDTSNPYHETAKEYFDSIDRVNEIYNELGMGEYDGSKLPKVPTAKMLKQIGVSQPKSIIEELKKLKQTINSIGNSNEIVPEAYNINEYNKKENEAIESSFKQLKTEISNLDLDKLNTPATEIFVDYFNDDNFTDEIRERFFNKDGTPKINLESGKLSPSPPLASRKKDEEYMTAYNRAKKMISDANADENSGSIKRKIEKIMKKKGIDNWPDFVDTIEKDNLGLNARERNKIMLNAIFATKTDIAQKHKDDMKQRERDFSRSAITAISKDPAMKSGTLKSLRENFPLKDVSEGSESMIIGDSVFSKSVLKKMFGTDDFNQIKDRLTVEEDSSGQPFLGYSAEVDTNGDGKSDNIIPISNISVRADGLGYGQTIKHEMKLRKDFYENLKKLNKEMGGNLTMEDIIYIVFGQRKTARGIIESLKSSLRDPYISR